MLGVSRSTFRRLVDNGLLEQVRLAPGMHPRYRRADVQSLIGKNGVLDLNPQIEVDGVTVIDAETAGEQLREARRGGLEV
jgi:excisionase family DNA binding protein